MKKIRIRLIKEIKCVNCGKIIGYTSNLSVDEDIYCDDCKNCISEDGN